MIKAAVLLIGPLLVLVVVTLAMYGTAGPADNDIRGHAMIRLLGMFYGIYLIALSYVWAKRKARNERQ